MGISKKEEEEAGRGFLSASHLLGAHSSLSWLDPNPRAEYVYIHEE